jgi:hypothetical protein
MSGLSPIEQHIRPGDRLGSGGLLVVRGWPLTVDGMLRNADLTRRRYSRSGEPFVAISAEVTVEGWDLDSILAGPRLRTRRSYATATVGEILHAGFELVPTFVVPTQRGPPVVH